MKDVIHSAEDHSPLLLGIGVGQHNFEKCPVAEKSDVDAAEKNAKDFAGWLAGQSREELARAIADLGRQIESRINQLGESKADLTKVQELACRVQELDERLDLAQGSVKNIRDDLETLEKRVAEVIARLPEPGTAAGHGATPPTDGTHYEDLEIGLKAVELNLREAVERITHLEQRAAAPDQTERSRGQGGSLTAEQDSRALSSSSFWQRLRWLFRGPQPPIKEHR
jgi:chromosome segregation ATPase